MKSAQVASLLAILFPTVFKWLHPRLETVQDFLCKLAMKPHNHLLKISISSLYHIIVRSTATDIMNRSGKKLCTFLEKKC